MMSQATQSERPSLVLVGSSGPERLGKLRLEQAERAAYGEIADFAAKHADKKVYLRSASRLGVALDLGMVLVLRAGPSIVAINSRVPLTASIADLSDEQVQSWLEGTDDPAVFYEMAHSVVRTDLRGQGIGAVMEAARLHLHIQEGTTAGAIWLVVKSNQEQLGRLRKAGLVEVALRNESEKGLEARAALVMGGREVRVPINPHDYVVPLLAPRGAAIELLRRGSEKMRSLKVRYAGGLGQFCNPDLIRATADFYEDQPFAYENGPWRRQVRPASKPSLSAG